jgi:hypothetical protein
MMAPPPKVEVRGSAESSVFDVRGGLFQYAERPCGPGVIIIAEVTGGNAELNLPGRPPAMVPTGSRLVTCVNCGNNSATADGTCQAGPMPPPAGDRPDATPPPGTGTRPPVGDAGTGMTDPRAPIGDAMPPPNGSPCGNGLVCMVGEICRTPPAADGSSNVCKCDGGRFICGPAGDATRSDAGLPPPPQIDGGLPPSSPCGNGLACMIGEICRTPPAADGSSNICKCDGGRFICSPAGDPIRTDGGVLIPPPPLDAGPAPMMIPPDSCKPGLMCMEGAYCRGEPLPDGSVLTCKCDQGKLICAGNNPGPIGTGGSGPPPPSGAGGAGGTTTPPPPPPGSCKPGLMCMEGSYCREPLPNGVVMNCKCYQGTYVCDSPPPPGSTADAGVAVK